MYLFPFGMYFRIVIPVLCACVFLHLHFPVTDRRRSDPGRRDPGQISQSQPCISVLGSSFCQCFLLDSFALLLLHAMHSSIHSLFFLFHTSCFLLSPSLSHPTPPPEQTVVEAIMQSQHCMITRFNASGNRCGLSPFVPLFAADSLRDLILEDCNIDDNDLLYLSKYLHQLQQQKVTSDNSYNLTADELRERERQLSAAAAAAEAAAEEEALKSGGKKKGKKGKGSGKSSSSSGGGGAGSAAVGSAAVARPVKILTACALQQVDLSMNPIGDIGVEALLSCLTVGSGKSLVYLGLNSCQFGDHAAQQICDSLPLFPSLIYLQLRANRIGNEGAVAFSKALLNDKVCFARP